MFLDFCSSAKYDLLQRFHLQRTSTVSAGTTVTTGHARSNALMKIAFTLPAESLFGA